MPTNWESRQLTSQDQDFLWDMLYVALWDAPDEPRRPRSVLDDRRIQKLAENWGRDEDFGLIAIDPVSSADIGAIWARLDGYDDIEGHGCDYPFLGIAVSEPCQGRGVGTFLMSRFIADLKGRVPGLRLGVNPRNARAIHVYQKMGFQTYATGAGGYPQMKLEFASLQ